MSAMRNQGAIEPMSQHSTSSPSRVGAQLKREATLPSSERSDRISKKQKSQDEVTPLPADLPALPAPTSEFLKFVAERPNEPIRELLQPYLEYEKVIRGYHAQNPDHEYVADNIVNLVSVYEEGNATGLLIRARDVENESMAEKDKYIMSLNPDSRRKNGEYSIVPNIETFKSNFSVFTEGALTNLDWSNIVCAGSSVLTPLLPVPEKAQNNRRELRDWYHEKLAPASDIDLFIYGIEDEEEAIKKMAHVEQTIKDNLLWETVTIRTKNTITIVSQYPNRHVQIVLRLYKSISQIITGFDVDCSCFAYDGSRVLANPRALVSCITQCNYIDLSRRSPSYENRLAKYAQRGFEIYCPFLDRSKIDPTIFERSFKGTVGLARLLVLEALPTPENRDAYQAKRREEMGRPSNIHRNVRMKDYRNYKERATEDVAEWDFEEDTSSYQRFVIPYGPKLNAKKIERMFFKKDLVLNGEWNKQNRPPHRMVNLHRHPVFFGDLKDVVEDCCGHCPKPANKDEEAVAEEESKTYVSGPLTIMHYREENVARQEIGSFNPLGPEDYTHQAYINASTELCQAIVDNNIEFVRDWCSKLSEEEREKAINERDYCGRTPLQLACTSESTGLEIVQCLIDSGARLVARLQDGRTALHIAAARGDEGIVRALLAKSIANAEEKERQQNDRDRKTVRIAIQPTETVNIIDNEDEIMEDADAATTAAAEHGSNMDVDDDGGHESDSEEDSEGFESVHMSHAASSKAPPTEVTGEGFVKVPPAEEGLAAEYEDEEDIDDIYDINVEDWDNNMSPLHHAILSGHTHMVELLIGEYGADPRRALKILGYDWQGKRHAKGAILNTTLSLNLEKEEGLKMLETLLKLGASTAQYTKLDRVTAFHYFCAFGTLAHLEKIFELDGPAALSVMNFAISEPQNPNYSMQAPYNRACVTPLVSAMMDDVDKAKLLLKHGARATIEIADTLRYLKINERNAIRENYPEFTFAKNVEQPIERAIKECMEAAWIKELIEHGANPNTICRKTFPSYRPQTIWNGSVETLKDSTWYPESGTTILELVQETIDECKKMLRALKVPATSEQPAPLIEESILNGFTGYKRWCLEGALYCKNKLIKQANESLETMKKRDQDDSEAKRNALWKSAIEEEIKQFEDIEKVLLEAGSKPYHELNLHPDAAEKWKINQSIKRDEALRRENMEKLQREKQEKGDKEKEEKDARNEIFGKLGFQFAFSRSEFNSAIGSYETLLDMHLQLMEAIWRGEPEDIETIKRLCLTRRKVNDEKVGPIRITTADGNGWTPLWLAVYRGHYHLIPVILEIVDKHYEAPEKTIPRPYYAPVDSDNSDDSEGSEIEEEGGAINEEDFEVHDAVEEDFTLKDPTSPFKHLVSTTMNVSATAGVSSGGRLGLFSGPNEAIGEEMVRKTGSSFGIWNNADWNVFSWAIYKDDMDLFRALEDLAKRYCRPEDLEVRGGKPMRMADVMFKMHLDLKVSSQAAYPRPLLGGNAGMFNGLPILTLAIALGRTKFLEHLMSEASFGIWYEDLQKKSEVTETKETPTYYQGLKVRGKRQSEWASASGQGGLVADHYHKPLHVAVNTANFESVRWLRSSRPWECLQEFMQANPDTDEVKLLREQGDKLQDLLEKGLGLKTNLLVHMVVHGWNEGSSRMLRALVQERPEYLTAATDNMVTPALYAVQRQCKEAAKELIDLGADFSARTKGGKNILHLLIDDNTSHETLKEWVEILPRDVVERCWTQRIAQIQRTPLDKYLSDKIKYGPYENIRNKIDLRVVKFIVEQSGGHELTITNSEGNTPIHTAFTKGYLKLAEYLISLRPSHLYRENANGRTPLEIIRSRFLQSVLLEPRKVLTNFERNMYHYPPRPQFSSDVRLAHLRKSEDYSSPSVKAATDADWSEPEQIRDLFYSSLASARELKAKGGNVKRELVGLTDAENVVKRLRDNSFTQALGNWVRYCGIDTDVSGEVQDTSVMRNWY